MLFDDVNRRLPVLIAIFYFKMRQIYWLQKNKNARNLLVNPPTLQRSASAINLILSWRCN